MNERNKMLHTIPKSMHPYPPHPGVIYIVDEVREAVGLSVEELALKSKVSVSTIRLIEDRLIYPSTETLQKIAKVLDCQIHELYRTPRKKAAVDTIKVPFDTTNVQQMLKIKKAALALADAITAFVTQDNMTIQGGISHEKE